MKLIKTARISLKLALTLLWVLPLSSIAMWGIGIDPQIGGKILGSGFIVCFSLGLFSLYLVRRTNKEKRYETPKASKYDNSTKQFEVLRKEYLFLKDGRKIWKIVDWHHWKYYSSMESASQAVRDLRKQRCIYDYPGNQYEEQFLHITPRTTLIRYKAICRNEKHP